MISTIIFFFLLQPYLTKLIIAMANKQYISLKLSKQFLHFRTMPSQFFMEMHYLNQCFSTFFTPINPFYKTNPIFHQNPLIAKKLYFISKIQFVFGIAHKWLILSPPPPPRKIKNPFCKKFVIVHDCIDQRTCLQNSSQMTLTVCIWRSQGFELAHRSLPVIIRASTSNLHLM